MNVVFCFHQLSYKSLKHIVSIGKSLDIIVSHRKSLLCLFIEIDKTTIFCNVYRWLLGHIFAFLTPKSFIVTFLVDNSFSSYISSKEEIEYEPDDGEKK